MSMISAVRRSGTSYGSPWNPSITWGPEAPSPRMKRPPDSRSRPTAVMASSVGVRVYRGRMDDPICARLVTAARKPMADTASEV